MTGKKQKCKRCFSRWKISILKFLNETLKLKNNDINDVLIKRNVVKYILVSPLLIVLINAFLIENDLVLPVS